MVRKDRIPQATRGIARHSDGSRGDPPPGEAGKPTSPRFLARHHSQPNRVQVRQRNGIWEVRVDGAFRGDYHLQEHALTAAAGLRRSM